MSDQDNFFKGVSLGMNAVQAGTQAQQFRTNLAERARQFDRNFSLAKSESEAQIARTNLAIKQAQLGLEAEQVEADNQAAQLDKYRNWSALAHQAYEAGEEIPVIPSGLTSMQGQAITYRDSLVTARENDVKYQASERERKDILDLIENYGLTPDIKEIMTLPSIPDGSGGQLQGVSLVGHQMLKEAKERRAWTKANRIAARYGTTPAQIAAQSNMFSVDKFFNYNGDLDEGLFDDLAKRASGLKPTGARVNRDGGTDVAFGSNDPDYTKIVKTATELATTPGKFPEDPDTVDEQERDEWIKHLSDPKNYPAPSAGNSDPFVNQIEAVINQ